MSPREVTRVFTWVGIGLAVLVVAVLVLALRLGIAPTWPLAVILLAVAGLAGILVDASGFRQFVVEVVRAWRSGKSE